MTSRQVADSARRATVLGPGNRRDKLAGRVFLGFLVLSLAVGFVTLATLIVDVLVDASFTVANAVGQPKRPDKRDQNQLVLEWDGHRWLFLSGM